MAINLTGAYAQVNNIKRNIFYDSTLTLKFFEMNKLILELTEGFYIRKSPSTNLAIGAEYFEASVLTDDTIDLEQIIPRCDRVIYGKNQYRIAQYFRPRDITQKWNLRLESSGKDKYSRE